MKYKPQSYNPDYYNQNLSYKARRKSADIKRGRESFIGYFQDIYRLKLQRTL